MTAARSHVFVAGADDAPYSVILEALLRSHQGSFLDKNAEAVERVLAVLAEGDAKPGDAAATEASQAVPAAAPAPANGALETGR